MALARGYGDATTSRLVADADVPGGQALELTIDRPGANAWDRGVNWPLTEDIRKGDTVFLAYWAKGISARNEAQTPVISRTNVQQSVEPYAIAATNTAFLTPDWALYYASGVAPEDIAAGASGLSFQAGLSAQTLRLGPAYVLNLGPGVDPRSLPQTRISYDGRAADAPWRAEAMSRIDRHRKADLRIRVIDADGQPLAGVPVTVEQTGHAFHFGSFVNHSFVAPDTADERKWQAVFSENFNTATLPLYWQDWGWNGDRAEVYRETIAYADGLDLAWRGHPILWPGREKMPSAILKNEGDPERQRRQVLDHVRDVMTHIAPYGPIAVDMVNETRDNRYFIEQGDPTLVADAFRLAHEIAPDIPLYVNDYGILNGGGLSVDNIETYERWISKHLSEDVPVGGIGFQAHFGSNLTPPERIMDILGRFAGFGLPLQITEFDIETLDEAAQADYTRDFVLAAFSEPALDAFFMWGFWEGTHWKTPAAMFRKDWTPKPNYEAWRKVIYETLWTDETVMTGPDGTAALRAFKGDYRVGAGGRTIEVTLDEAAEVTLTP